MIRVLPLAWCALLLGVGAVTSETAPLLDTGRLAYDADRFDAAAAAFTEVLSEIDDEQDERQAAYLLSLILLFQDGVDVERLIQENDGLDAGLEPVAVSMRRGDRRRAAEALAFLRFREAGLAAATRRLLPALEARIGGVTSAYVAAWEREIAFAADVSIGPRDQPWVLITGPPAFARLDRNARIVESVAFVVPESLDQDALREARFAVRHDGSFQLGAHRFAASGRALDSTLVFAPTDVAALVDGTTVFLHGDGLRAVTATGSLQWQTLGRGRRSGSFNHPQAVAHDGRGLIVAESKRLQRFDKQGAFVEVLEVDARSPLPAGFRLHGVTDVATAADRIFVGHLNAPTIDVYSNRFAPLTTLRLPANRIAATSDGMVFGLKHERLSAAFKVPRQSLELARVPPTSRAEAKPTGSDGQSQREPIAFVPLEPLPDYVRIHPSTRHTTSLAISVAADAVWIGSYGGVLRWQPQAAGVTAWRQWTRMDGLPSDVVHNVHAGADGAVWAITNGAVLLLRHGDSNWHRLERDGFPVNGKFVIGDVGNPGFVWIAAQRGLLRLHARSTTAEFVPMPRGPEEVVQLPDERLFVRLGVNGVAAVEPTTGKTRVIVEMEDLKTVPGVRNAESDRWIMTLSGDTQAGVLWIGTDRREVFAIDLSTERLRGDWIDGAMRSGCRRGEIRAKRVAGKLHFVGQGCYMVREGPLEPLQLVLEHRGRGQDLLAFDDALILATTEGLYRIAADGRAMHVARHGSEPPDWAVKAIAQVDGRIWVGFGNQGVGIYDGHEWREIADTASVDRFRVGPDGVLAVASFGAGRAFRASRDGARFERIAPGGRSWMYLRDLFFDGDAWWGVGAPDPNRKHGIRVWRAGREEHWGRQSGMPFGEARRIVADPDDPDVLWLATDAGLVRLRKTSRRADVVWPGDLTWLETFGDGVLWAYGGDLLRFDTRTGIGSPFPLRGLPAPDPTEANRLWVVHDDELLCVDARSAQPLARYPIGLGSLSPYGLELVTGAAGTSAWIASFNGLLEIRIADHGHRD